MKSNYTASYPGKPAKKIQAFDYSSAVKQAAYWFGCAYESDRLSVRQDDSVTRPDPYLSGGVISDSHYHAANE